MTRPQVQRGPIDPARILGYYAENTPANFAWLDGSTHSASYLGVDADAVIEADDLRPLDAIDRLWAEAPDRVWVGVLSYDLGADAVLGRPPRAGRGPGLCFRRYRAAASFQEGRAPVIAGEQASGEELLQAVAAAQPVCGAPWPLGPLEPMISPAQYRERVSRARAYIEAGETYQVNLSQGFRAGWTQEGKALSLPHRVAGIYQRLREKTPAELGALIELPTHTIVSNSPETLLDVRDDDAGRRARSWPIKGTIARGRDAAGDAAAMAELMASEKDRAEHLMIVDLLRNDLGRLAVTGTVRAPATPKVWTLPTVHHLVSEVSATLRPDVTLSELVAAMFPGGSITGAPKRRTVQIIDELEGDLRGVYCGAVVVLGPTGARWSIPIRTGEVSEAGLYLRAGGGVVADSDPELERQETVLKTRAFAP